MKILRSIFKRMVIAVMIWESKAIIRKYKPFIVAVTGSVGKTSTKDAVYCLLNERFKYVRKSEKSMNSEIGLPLTVIGVPNAWYSAVSWSKNIFTGLRLIFFRREYPDCLVLEIGADHPGDIQSVMEWMHPDVSIMTMVSKTPVHVEFFHSPEQVFKEKSALAHGVKEGGILVLFADDDSVLSLGEAVKSKKGIKVTSYGLGDKAKVKGGNYSVSYSASGSPTGISFDLSCCGIDNKINLDGVLGDSYAYPLLASAALGEALDMSTDVIMRGLNTYKAPKGRMNILEGLNGSTIIDDTYNSSPDAASSALQSLSLVKTTGSKIAVLGDMMELGKYSADEHRRIGKIAAGIVDRLVTVGQRSRLTAKDAKEMGMASDKVISFDNSNDAASYLPTNIHEGDIILVKGSQSMRMERVAKALLKEPAKADKLLVRQEREWLCKE